MINNLKPNLYRFLFKFFVGLVFATLGMYLSRRLLFLEKPLFGYSFLGEFSVGLALTTFSVLFLPTIIFNFWVSLTEQFRIFISRIVSRSVSEFVAQRSRQVEARRKREKDSVIILDTSALIDGRILGVIEAGFIENPLIVPQFVLEELQSIADSSDDLRRQKGRRGLSILEKIKKSARKNFRVLNYSGEKSSVDQSLINLAKELGGKIATVDYNLNKVATVSGIKVLNVNDLANALKTQLIPGERLILKIIQLGKEKEQGVGYLNDGTMVVVERGNSLIGQEVSIEVSRVIQTSAGKMIFAKPLR